MSLPLLTKISELVRAGATVVGPPPQYAPGLKGYPAQDKSVAKLAKAVWGSTDAAKTFKKQYGKGRIFWGQSFPQIFKEMDLISDFKYSAKTKDADLVYTHRRTKKEDIYFIANSKFRAEEIVAQFRVNNKVPYLFRPDTGEMTALAHYRQKGRYLEIPMALDPAGSVFIIFSAGEKQEVVTDVEGPGRPVIVQQQGKLLAKIEKPGKYQFTTSTGTKIQKMVTLPKVMPIRGAWDIFFKLGKNNKKINSPLFPWNTSKDKEIRYYGDAAIYKKTFKLPADYLREAQRVYIDLGDVQKMAKVKINGQACPDLWKPPYRLDITEHVKAGRNEIEVTVICALMNSLIGDEEHPEDLTYTKNKFAIVPDWIDGSKPRPSERKTFTIKKFARKGQKLIPAGLIGPVKVQVTKLLIIK